MALASSPSPKRPSHHGADSKSFSTTPISVALTIVVVALYANSVAKLMPNKFAGRLQGPKPNELTLRQVLSSDLNNDGFHLAMAPAFFGFYGYFGALAAWEEAVNPHIFASPSQLKREERGGGVRSVAGASAGAMAAILLAAGVSPTEAADFCSNVTYSTFADFPAFGAVFRGNLFQQAMHTFVRQARPQQSLLMQDAVLPMAVSAFDLQTMQGKVLSRGNMARAARASATFPILFQPVGWQLDDDHEDNVDLDGTRKHYTLIDGGIGDPYGWNGLVQFVAAQSNRTAQAPPSTTAPAAARQRIVHIQMGASWFGHYPGPSKFMAAAQQHGWSIPANSVEVISISLENLPQCGPWALYKGPIAVAAARQAMIAALDTPLKRSAVEDHHYTLRINALPFWKKKK